MEHMNHIDTKSGFCRSNSTFYSKRAPISFPANQYLDVTTFISSFPHHGKIALIDAISDHHLTFNDLWKAINSVSSSLSDLGIRKGHVVLLFSPNSIFFPIVCLSVMLLGAVITTANPLNTPREISKQIAISKPSFVFTIPQLLIKFSASKSTLPVVLISNDDQLSSTILVSNVKIVGHLLEMMKKEPHQTSNRETVTLDDPACLLFSSGTTGESKGVFSTHGTNIARIQITTGRFMTHERDQVYLAAIPMFHTFGLSVFLDLFCRGCTLVVLPKFDMDNALAAIQKYRVTFFPIAPPVIVSLISNADDLKKRYDLNSLRYLLCGGAPLSKEVSEEFDKEFPNISILQGYALTESGGAGASMETPEESRRFGSVGLITPNTEAKIIDLKTGEGLSVNRSGELWLKAPSVMKGYLNNEEATKASIHKDGWLKTGDICYINDDGFMFVVDRLKELIKYKGHQVPPAELENLLLKHPEITDAAVIPFPDEKVGQYPMAYVVRKTGSSVSDIDIMDFINRQVAPYKKVRRVAFIKSIPKNPTGKILRKNLITLATSKI